MACKNRFGANPYKGSSKCNNSSCNAYRLCVSSGESRGISPERTRLERLWMVVGGPQALRAHLIMSESCPIRDSEAFPGAEVGREPSTWKIVLKKEEKALVSRDGTAWLLVSGCKWVGLTGTYLCGYLKSTPLS